MKRYKTILEDENKQSVLLFGEPEVMYLTGLEEYQAKLHKQKIISSIHKFLIFSSDSTSVSTLNFYLKNQYRSYDSSITINAYSDIDFLNDAFQFINTKEVKRFLFYHPEILQTLLDCHIEIITRFDIVIPKMELITDIELPEWETLFITIPHGMEYNNAFDQLNDLLQNWVLYQPKHFKRAVTISLEDYGI